MSYTFELQEGENALVFGDLSEGLIKMVLTETEEDDEEIIVNGPQLWALTLASLVENRDIEFFTLLAEKMGELFPQLWLSSSD